MPEQRRNRGDGGTYWDEARQRWIITVYVGFTPAGKRRKVRISARTKTEARSKLRKLMRESEEGNRPSSQIYTVGDAVESWLAHGLGGRAETTIKNRIALARTHIIPSLGRRKLIELSADEVDEWLAWKAETLSTDTLRRIIGILRQSISRAQARELIRINVASLCEIPHGQQGRPSKSLTEIQARALLDAAAQHPRIEAYIVLSMLTGARTEELRALTWDHVDLDSQQPSIRIWRSVRRGGDTKTPRSRRTLELPQLCVDALRAHEQRQAEDRLRAGTDWPAQGIVFASEVGTELDAANIRRRFRKVVADAGLDPAEWTPRELRHSFVSLLSNSGVAIEDIAHLVGHANTRVTEKVYRKELRPVLTRGAKAMDELFRTNEDPSEDRK